MEFVPLYPWTLLPKRQTVKSASIHSGNADDFRRAAQCAPYVRGVRLGYQLISPVDFTMEPLNEQQFQCEAIDLETEMRRRGLTEAWHRSQGYIGLKRPFALKTMLMQATADGPEIAMFIPNGQNTIEWKFGFGLIPQTDHGIAIIADSPPSGLEVLTAVLTSAELAGMNACGGFAAAVRPIQRVEIRRGQPIARLIEVPRP